MKDERLSYELVEIQPEYFDFSEGYAEKWEIPLDLTEEEQENEEYTPKMNYIYPLGDAFQVPKDFRKKLDYSAHMNGPTCAQLNGPTF
jgi:hypothetical protein